MIAPILTMFFLATYGLINLACGLERWAASPGFRPVFKVPASVSLLGSLACFYVMSIINLPAMLAALLLCAAIFVFTSRRDLGTTYGDARHGIWSALVRSALLKLREASFHPGNWRPNLIILGGNPEKRPWLLELGSALVQKRGIVTYFLLLTGSIQERAKRQRTMGRELSELFHHEHPNVFFRVDMVPEVYPGIVQVVQSYGVGSFEANTVMLGWPSQSGNTRAYLQMLRELVELDRSLLLVHSDPKRRLGERRSIHIWWGGLPDNGGLMLLLAHLLLADPAWRDARMTLITVVDDEVQRVRASESPERIIEDARVDAQTMVLLRQGRPIGQIMAETSGDADLAILGLGLPDSDDEADAFFERMNRMLEGMPTTLLVRSARTFRGEPVLFEMDETR